MQLDAATTQTAGHTGREGAWDGMAEIYVLQFDVVAIVNVGDIDASLVVLLGLHALGESHDFGLYLAVGVEGVNGLHTPVGGYDGGEGAVSVILKLFDGHAAAEATAAGQLARVVEKVGMSLEVGHAAMVGEGVGTGEWHHLAGIPPGAFGMWRRAVADVFRNATGSIEEEIFTPLSFRRGVGGEVSHQPRTFHVGVFILLAGLALVHHGSAEGFLGHVECADFTVNGNHVVVELGVIYLGVAPHNPCLLVAVNHDRGVNVVPGTVLVKRLADGIAERSCGGVADCHADGHAAGNLRVGADVPVKFAVAFNALRGPGTVVSPRERFEGEW